ncbi:autotransporter outer membrane beta-barrel domain-containing protein [Paraburkholderia aspalathi]|nr:autotransporter outer membrane beta-barrel domain-containing protein [Paraburkholderia aspalathi]
MIINQNLSIKKDNLYKKNKTKFHDNIIAINIIISAGISAALMYVQLAKAESVSWQYQTGDNYWSLAKNWSTTTVPQLNDDVIVKWVENVGTLGPVYDVENSTIKSITIGDATQVGTLKFKNASKLTVIGETKIGGYLWPLIEMNGAGQIWTSNGNITIGYVDNNTSSPAIAFNVFGGSKLHMDNDSDIIIGATANSLGTLNGVGANSEIIANDIILGNPGMGGMILRDGATITNKKTHAAFGPGSQSQIEISGPNTLWSASDDVIIGDSGNASAHIATGAILHLTGPNNKIIIANKSGSSGSLHIGDTMQDDRPSGSGAINAKTIQFGDGTGTIKFNHTDSDYKFDAQILGLGAIYSLAGTTSLTGANSYTGQTVVSGGKLWVQGDQTAAIGATSVARGATLGGGGTVGGDVNIASGGALRSFIDGTGPHALTIRGNLDAAGAELNYDYSDRDTIASQAALKVDVAGDLNINGAIITIISNEPLAPGTYNLIQYGGTGTSTGAALSDDDGGNYVLRTTGSQKIDLISTAGLELNFWDAGSHSDNTVNGGTGTWQAAGTLNNWADQDGNNNGKFTDGSFAVFEGEAGTVTIDNANGVISVSGMQFATDGYLLKDGTITLASGDNHIRVGGGVGDGPTTTATISSVIAGAGKLDKIDAGILKLTATNTYSGGTVIGAGTLSISDDKNLGAVSAVLEIAGGTLQMATNLTSSRAISVTATNSAIDTLVNNGTLSGLISGSGILNKNGTGILTLSGINTYSGGTTINAGTLIVSTDNNLGDTTGALTINKGTLQAGQDFNSARSIVIGAQNSAIATQAHNNTFSGVISGSGVLNKNGAGTLTLTGTNTYSGGTVINAGTLIVSNDTNLGDTNGVLTINDAALQTAEDFNSTRSITLAAQHSTIDTQTHNNTFSGILSGNGALVKKGSGTLTLSNLNTYSGGTSVTAGVISIYQDKNLGDISGTLILDSGTLQLTQNITSARQITLGTGNGTIDTQNFTSTLNGIISGTGTLTTIGSGTTVLAGINTYTGSTNIQAGELRINGNQTAATGNTAVAAGTVLSGKGIIGGSVAVAATGSLLSFVDNTGTGLALTIKGDLTANDAKLEYNYADHPGLNILQVTVNGDINLAGSEIDVSASSAMAAGVYHLMNYSGELQGAVPTLGTVPAGSFEIRTTVPNQIDLLNTSGLNLGFWDPTGKNDGHIGGGTGIWQIGGLLDNWTDTAGVLNAAFTDGAFAVFEGKAGVVTVNNGNGDIHVSGMQFATDGYIVENGTITLAAGDDDIRVGDGGASASSTVATIASILAGTGRLQKNDAGKLVLLGSNTYTGGTSIKGGTLNISADDNMGDASGGISISAGTLQFASSFTSDRRITVLSEFSTIDTQNNNATIGGIIDGSGSLNKKGSGTLTLKGKNSFSGRMNIVEGVLALAGNGKLSASSGITVDGTLSIAAIENSETSIQNLIGSQEGKILLGDKTLGITDGQSSEFKGEISGTGALHVSGGKQILSGSNSYTGGTAIDNGATLQVGNGGTTGSIEGPVDLIGTLAFTRADQITSNNILTGNGTLELTGAGATILAANSPDFVGTTNLRYGTLITNQSLGGLLNIFAATTLSGSGTVGTTVNNGTILPGHPDRMGTLTIAGDYTGNSGKLVIKTALGDDSSASDLLHVTGSTSGNTTVTVQNRNGLGAQTEDGIRIIKIDGASNGHFNLVGDFRTHEGKQAVVAGAYAYTLANGTPAASSSGDWYLRSQLKDPKPNEPAQPLYQPGVPLYSSYSHLLNTLNRNMISTLRDRTGGRYEVDKTQLTQQERDELVWGRIEMVHGHYAPQGAATKNTFDLDIWQAKAGIDGQFQETDSGQLFGSVWLTYANAKTDVSSPFGRGEIGTDGYGLGAATTWYGNNGIYVDAQGHVSWYNSDLTSDTLGHVIASSKRANGYGVSLEAGQRLSLDENWSVTPQAQLVYSAVKFDGFQDIYQTHISGVDIDSLSLRIGFAANYQQSWRGEHDDLTRLNIYGIANLYRDILQKNQYMEISRTKVFIGETEKTWGEIGIGSTYDWGNDKYALYGNVTTATGLDDFARQYTVSGKLGIQVKW